MMYSPASDMYKYFEVQAQNETLTRRVKVLEDTLRLYANDGEYAAEALAAYESVKPNEDFFETFQRINTERQSMWCEDREGNPLFFAVELGGEVGEALNEVKKLEREKLGWRGSRTTIDKLADELADVIICTQNLANCYGIDLREAVTHKFNVTSDKVGFSQKLPALNKD